MTETQRDWKEGALEQAEDGRWQLQFERLLRLPPDEVWRALTEEAHVAAWFRRPSKVSSVGAPLRFLIRGEELPPTTGEMIACEPAHVSRKSDPAAGHRPD